MKNTLGKLLLLLVMISPIDAEDFSSHIKSDTQDAYLKQAIHLSVELNQTNSNIVLFFQFSINKSDDYVVYPLHAKHDNALHHTYDYNNYVIYPLKTGDINVTFSLTKRVTDDNKVAHFASGDRDDFKKLETKDTPIMLAPLTLHVKPVPQGTQLIGDFTLKSNVQTHSAKVHAPIGLHIDIEGDGYIPLIEPLLPSIPHVNYFSQTPSISKKQLPTTLHYHVNYTMALSSDRNFTLPQQSYLAFNPKTQKIYTLTLNASKFTIHPVAKNTLVDTIDNPPNLTQHHYDVQHYLKYLLIYLAGILTTWAWKMPRTTKKQVYNPLITKIKEASDAKALLQLLMAQNPENFQQSISALENALYQNGKINLAQIKKEAIATL